MIVDRLDSRSLDAAVERSARVRWDGGERRIQITVPAALAGPEDDASPWLALTLLAAMRRHEELEVDGEVSARLLARVEALQTLYHGWDLGLRRCEVSVGGSHSRTPPQRRAVASCFTRGVDSTYSATAERAWPGALELLLFVDGLEPKHTPADSARDVARAQAAAELIGLPLAVCHTNLRECVDGLLAWGDVHGAALAAIALSLAGGVRHLVVPSSQSPAGVGPLGSSPMSDPLYSTETVEIEHDMLLGRTQKALWIARERPELLEHLEVCFLVADGNCGRCGKCLHTMATLEAAGALQRASAFPGVVDVGRVSRLRHDLFEGLMDWMDVWRVLPEGPLRTAVARSLRRSAVPGPRDVLHELRRRRSPLNRWSRSADQFAKHRYNTARSLQQKGRPYP
ncbi:MAG TPA: hypothetical protein VI111_11185 [Thermoleophilaceae bacterium]